MEMAAITHRGNVRENNEDAYYLDVESGRLYAIADGMGGHRAGEVASAIAIEALKEAFEDQEAATKDPVAMIQKAFLMANERIDKEATNNSHCEGMGTTLTMAYKVEQVLFIGHIGDSRAFLFQEGKLRQITRDHSLVGELVRSGAITEEEAKNHPQRNVIMKALGSSNLPSIDVQELEFEPDDLLMLCSDGLSDYVTVEAMSETFLKHIKLTDAVRDLCDQALAQGGHDNITIVAVRL